MSKVIHLSDEAHNRAKAFCKDQGLRMSDWVAELIEQAIAGGKPVAFRAPAADSEGLARKKPMHRLEEAAKAPVPVQEGVPAYAAPPFWARRK